LAQINIEVFTRLAAVLSLNLASRSVFVCEALILITLLGNPQCSFGNGERLPKQCHIQLVVISERAQTRDQLLQSFLHLAPCARVVTKLRRRDHVLLHLYVEIHRGDEFVVSLQTATAQRRLVDLAGEVTHFLAKQNLLKFGEYLIGDFLGFSRFAR